MVFYDLNIIGNIGFPCLGVTEAAVPMPMVVAAVATKPSTVIVAAW